jgi:hypothetical protein
LICVIPEAAKRLSGIHNHRYLVSAPFVVMDSGLALRAPRNDGYANLFNSNLSTSRSSSMNRSA